MRSCLRSDILGQSYNQAQVTELLLRPGTTSVSPTDVLVHCSRANAISTSFAVDIATIVGGQNLLPKNIREVDPYMTDKLD